MSTQFKKGQSGNAKGRPKTVGLSKAKKIEAMFKKLGLNPLAELAALAESEDATQATKLKAYTTLAAYYAPTIKAVDSTSGESVQEHSVIVQWAE